MTETLRITARRDGFRRAGLSHPAIAVDRAPRDFTDAQLAALEAEPMLVVQRIEQVVEPASPPTDPPAAEGAEPGRKRAAKAG